MGSRFGRVLRAPHLRWLAVTSVFARLPYGVDALAILLYVQDRTGSFAIGGLVSACTAVIAAASTPVLGRLIDRIGQTSVLAGSAMAHAAGILALLALGEAGAPTAALAACAAVAGLYPPISPCLRSLYGQLLDDDPEDVRTALALDAILLELVFIGGPLMAAALFAVGEPAAALLLVVVLATAGTLAFAASPASRRWRGTPRESGLLGALTSPGLRTLLMTAVPLGMAFGAIEVALPAFGVEHGERAIGGVAIAALSLGSAVGGVVYGVRVPADVRRSYLWLAAALPLGLVLLALATSTLSLLLLALPAGALIAPLTAAENELTASVAPEGTVTEAYSWVITATVAGVAVGTAASGALVEASSWRTALLAAAGVAVFGAVAALARRRTLSAPVPA